MITKLLLESAAAKEEDEGSSASLIFPFP
ncbi:hypothetical protein RDI58_010418 [Solanum bulbocastanum]|uniref:Uncharacterized protein n=1 Tax=Solanum bulbocastanum TaxID=147425 RepID=A0AAN8YGC6_SOLBU